MKALLDNLKALGPRRLAILGGVGLLVLAAIGWLAWEASRPKMAILYSGIAPAEAGQIVSQLEAMGITVGTSFDGSTIQVPAPDVARARMALAEKGLPSASGVGYELFDADNGLGLTSFMQQMNRLRAMEGELGRTIATLSGVESARVHLVLPEREAFARTAPTPTAAVVVRMRGGFGLDRQQARAIRHLVAAAVPNLKPADVTLLDAAGEVLLTEGDDGPGQPSSEGLKASLETRLAKAVEDLLVPRFGRGNVRVTVAADLDMSHEVVRTERFDPDGQVPRSTQTVEERQSSSDGTGDLPTTVQQNLPDAQIPGAPQPPGSNTTSQSQRTEETVNYEISAERREKVREAGELRRLSVAVLVNGRREPDADGTSRYVPRSQEELDAVTALVRTAVGASQDRGDVVTVQNLEFADLMPAGADEDSGFFAGPWAGLLGTLVQWLAVLGIAALVVLYLLRPLLERLTAPPPAPAEPPLASAETAEPTATAEAAADEGSPFRLDFGDREEAIRALADAFEDYPDEAAAILRSLIREDAPA
ncbi:flagellar basal-body MS-ring/collar protein FliF [Inquilinus limosus]|uniref:flagellar basal-body MS-ring/collar protein FliF n=1 Tax=Inquilinus limosus TaxID=171674 RepID=UPI000479572D|nr:flagellar basal-body MS-ring/collar protein FliF [Inquilinus limosus]